MFLAECIDLLKPEFIGTLIDIEGTADPFIDENGDIIGFLGIHRDISDRKRFEGDLIQAKEKAEESDLIGNYVSEIR